MFKVGDKVCYPLHGAGIIESIEEKTIMGEEKDYYILRFALNRLTIMLPVDSCIGLREVLPIASIDAIFCEPAEEEFAGNWNKRYKNNLDQLRSGEVTSVACVVNTLTIREREKGLSAGEKKMLVKARQILVSEILLATNLDEEEINEKIDCNII